MSTWHTNPNRDRSTLKATLMLGLVCSCVMGVAIVHSAEIKPVVGACDAIPGTTSTYGMTPDGRLLITYQRDPALTNLTYTVDVSSSLVTWTTIARSTNGIRTSNLGGLSEVIETGTSNKTVTVFDLARPATRFIRLVVSQ